MLYDNYLTIFLIDAKDRWGKPTFLFIYFYRFENQKKNQVTEKRIKKD